MELVRPRKQNTWGWPAVINFSLGGMSTGFYLLGSLYTILGPTDVGSPPAEYKLLAPILTVLGFLALTVEAGHPLRSRFLFRHLRRSWMSREALAAVIFVPAALLDVLLRQPILWMAAAAAAAVLMISQGFILQRARAVTAWTVSLIPVLFVTSGLATGAGLLLLIPPQDATLEGVLPGMGLVCAVANLCIWLLYLGWSRDPAFRKATSTLRQRKALIFTVGVGHLLPVLLLVPGLVGSTDAGTGLERLATALAALALIVGGVRQKVGIILEAGYLRGIVLGPSTTTRSSGVKR